ncbi:MAG TPA: two-component system response regulator [Prolixibacteraceae bacterium]|nr:two-component system response regulator [Prolixibacteraceae bacterium]
MKKILIIDDKPSISKIIVQILSKTYEVSTQEDGLQALTWLHAGNIPDLIITDLQMPNMDGIELIKRVKESGFFRDIPVVVLSSKDSSADRIKCLKMGAEDYLVKPFNPEELLIRIERILQR